MSEHVFEEYLAGRVTAAEAAGKGLLEGIRKEYGAESVASFFEPDNKVKAHEAARLLGVKPDSRAFYAKLLPYAETTNFFLGATDDAVVNSAISAKLGPRIGTLAALRKGAVAFLPENWPQVVPRKHLVPSVSELFSSSAGTSSSGKLIESIERQLGQVLKSKVDDDKALRSHVKEKFPLFCSMLAAAAAEHTPESLVRRLTVCVPPRIPQSEEVVVEDLDIDTEATRDVYER